jgi:hypothetical protein
VAARFGVVLTGLANEIVTQIKAPEWTVLAGGPAAAKAASIGKFVVAGLEGCKLSEPQAHGHVAIVVDGPLWLDRYPRGYWGKLDSVGEKNAPLTHAWKQVDLANVVYACHET